MEPSWDNQGTEAYQKGRSIATAGIKLNPDPKKTLITDRKKKQGLNPYQIGGELRNYYIGPSCGNFEEL